MSQSGSSYGTTAELDHKHGRPKQAVNAINGYPPILIHSSPGVVPHEDENFDAIKNKHEAAKRIYEATRGMTIETEPAQTDTCAKNIR